MKVALYRVAGGWAVKTSHQELVCTSLHDAVYVAAKHAKTASYEAADRGSLDI